MTDDDIRALADRLDDSAAEHSRRAFSDRCVSPDCALSSTLASAAATALRDLLARLAKAEAERDEASKAIAWANNSLFGSYGFFLSLNGGPANEHHLDGPIEDLKERARRGTRTEARLGEAMEALRFYGDQWEQDVDAERTVHGWEGTIGDLEPTNDLLRDGGSKARATLAEIEATND